MRDPIQRRRPPPRRIIWILFPKQNLPTRIYLIANFMLYAYASGVFAAQAYGAPHVTVSLALGSGGLLVWSITAGGVALSQLVALFRENHTIFRWVSAATTAWAVAYDVDLFFGLLNHRIVGAGLVLWSWVVVMHSLFIRYRLALDEAPEVPPPTPEEIPQVRRLRDALETGHEQPASRPGSGSSRHGKPTSDAPH
jgi:hypothetical protein